MTVTIHQGDCRQIMSDQYDHAINVANRISLAVQLRDKLVEAQSIDCKTCGNCFFWMMSRGCPHEHNVRGRQRGPHMNEMACGKFKIKDCVSELKVKRMAEAVAFAKLHHIPMTYSVSSDDGVRGS